MVTEAGKELLRNTINTANFHNRILEENEMWKQWELERGLTMMVSDDLTLKRIKRHHQCSKHRRRSKSKTKERIERSDDINEASSSREAVDRWDHSGFKELYPNVDDTEATYDVPTPPNHAKKWDHSGFLELYPEEAEKYKSTKLQEVSKKSKKKKRKHHVKESTSDTEIWEEFKTFRRQKKSKKKSEAMPCDNHIKEFKKYSHKHKNS